MSEPASGRGGSWQGMRLGRYDLIAQLGSGGMADVYLGVVRGPAGFSKLVVLKVLRSRFVNDAEFLRMFLDEARLSARFNHPNVVQTFEVEEDLGRHFLVMEYLEGRPMADFDDGRGDMPLPSAVRVLVDVLSGLHYAHNLTDLDGQPLGIVHRDVSPQNVFVTYDGPAKVLDFGVAKAKNALSQTQDGAIKGKVRYMAPEQVSGEEIDHRVDLFAAGILLWRAATGKKLWGGYDQLAIMHRLVDGEPVPSPRTVRADVPRAVNAICEKALALRPEDRFQTAAEFAVALEEYLHDVGAQGSHRAVAQALEARYAQERSKFRSFVDERLRSLEARPAERASNSRRGADLEAVSSQHPGFGVLLDFPAANASGRVLTGSLPSSSLSAVGAPAVAPRRRLLPLLMGAAGICIGAFSVATAALRYVSGHAQPGAPVALSSAPSLGPSPAPPFAAPAASEPAGFGGPSPQVPPDAPSAQGAGEPGGPSPGGAPPQRRGKGRGPKGPRQAASAAAPSAESAPAPAPARQAPAVDPCASPYYIDERGVKKVKRECL